MWKLLKRLVNAAELRKTISWFTASAILQGVTLALMIPFLRALFSGSPAAPHWLLIITVCGVATVLVDTYAMFRSYRISVYEVCDTMIDRVAEHVLRLPLGWFNPQREAAVANATSTHVNTLSHVASLVIPNILNAFVTPLVMLLATFFVDWRLALIMGAAIFPLILVWRVMGASVTRANELESNAAEKAAGRLIEFARLQAVLRATGVGANWQPVQEALAEDAAAVMRGLRVKSKPAQGFNLIVNVTFALVLAAGWAFVSNYQLDAVAYLVLMAVVARMLLPLTQASLNQAEANNALVALRAVVEIMDAEPLPEPPAGHARRPDGATIEFTDVRFAYEADRQILDGISFQAPQGSVTAVVGPSGCGKSTILRLAARFWDVDAGAVTIGGVDVREIGSLEIMNHIAMVFQDVYLFDETIRENLRVARPDATDAELETAARRARLDRVIEALPHGWDTKVGPAGKSLSGGERQRVAIARAFLKDAPILLLDEITSALDGENEAAISEVVAELSAGRTVIVVAHRLSTIRNADQVIVLGTGKQNEVPGGAVLGGAEAPAGSIPADTGVAVSGARDTGAPAGSGARIVQRGTPAALAAQPGQFRDMVEALLETKRWQLTN